MKTRTKLLTALLSTVTALSCALTAAAAPAITLQGNEATPATAETNGTATATLTLKATQFSEVGGADLTLTLDNGITLVSAVVKDTASNGVWTLTDGENIKVSGNKVKMVDVFNLTGAPTKETLELTLTFNVSGATVGNYEVTLDAKLADTNATLIEGVTPINGTLVIGRAKEELTKTQAGVVPGASANYFIPFGAYTGTAESPNILTKKADGSFDTTGVAESETIYAMKCKLPTVEKKVTTFATAKKAAKTGENLENYEKYNGIQFGSYATDKDATYGTFVIIGDFNAFKEAYKSKYATNEAVLDRIAALYDKTITSESKFLKLKYGDKYIYVGRNTRTKYMWNGDSAIQYALRVYNVYEDQTYTAVGYFVTTAGEAKTYTFSNEIQTAVYQNMQ